jgi:hypothetical protein
MKFGYIDFILLKDETHAQIKKLLFVICNTSFVWSTP